MQCVSLDIPHMQDAEMLLAGDVTKHVHTAPNQQQCEQIMAKRTVTVSSTLLITSIVQLQMERASYPVFAVPQFCCTLHMPSLHIQ